MSYTLLEKRTKRAIEDWVIKYLNQSRKGDKTVVDINIISISVYGDNYSINIDPNIKFICDKPFKPKLKGFWGASIQIHKDDFPEIFIELLNNNTKIIEEELGIQFLQTTTYLLGNFEK